MFHLFSNELNCFLLFTFRQSFSVSRILIVSNLPVFFDRCPTHFFTCSTGKHTSRVETVYIFNSFPYKPRFLCVCSTSVLTTLWEKEKLLVTSNFSFSHSVFYPFEALSAIFIKFEIVVCNLFQFGRV